MPTTTAGQLRNCSVHLRVDLTNWRVMASDRVNGFASNLVAVRRQGGLVPARPDRGAQGDGPPLGYALGLTVCSALLVVAAIIAFAVVRRTAPGNL